MSNNNLKGSVNAILEIGSLLGIYSEGHPERVAQLACGIALKMGFSEKEVEWINIMGLLHDIGKAAVPRSILSKPVTLCEIEWKIIREHSTTGSNIVKNIAFPYPVATAICQHHERIDGSGYPQGLSDGQIIPEAKILAIAEVVEAIATDQMYRPGQGIDAALLEIEKNSGTLYDAEVVNACLKLFREDGFNLK